MTGPLKKNYPGSTIITPLSLLCRTIKTLPLQFPLYAPVAVTEEYAKLMKPAWYKIWLYSSNRTSS